MNEHPFQPDEGGELINAAETKTDLSEYPTTGKSLALEMRAIKEVWGLSPEKLKELMGVMASMVTDDEATNKDKGMAMGHILKGMQMLQKSQAPKVVTQVNVSHNSDKGGDHIEGEVLEEPQLKVSLHEVSDFSGTPSKSADTDASSGGSA